MDSYPLPDLDTSSFTTQLPQQDDTPAATPHPQQDGTPTTPPHLQQTPQLAHHPTFGDLQCALKQECADGAVPYSLLGMVSQCSEPPMPFVVSVRAAMLHARFLPLEDCRVVHSSASELRHFYCLNAAELESQRHQALLAVATTLPWQHVGINSVYDHHHHGLIERVEQSLQLLETRSVNSKPLVKPRCHQPKMEVTETPTTGLSPPQMSGPCQPDIPPPTRVVRRSIIKPLSNLASCIMSNWYGRNKEHPYPSYETAEVLAKAGNINVEQVKRWFANRRQRTGNTKTLTEVADRRRRARTESSEIFLTEGKRFRDLE